jgi:uncharacterized membrane protein YdjX (TVP38/TMEM64 family)
MNIGIVIAIVTSIAAMSFLAVGESAESVRHLDAAIHDLRNQGSWAWLGAIGLICTDLVLPVPTSSVIAGLGAVYGLAFGAMVGAIGLIASGTLGYAAVRMLGRPVAAAIASEEQLTKLQGFFERSGAWAIVLTRGLPIVPEAVSCLAGLARMRLGKFLVALTLGSLPMSVVFAAIGAGWREHPSSAMAAAYVAPLLLLPVALYLLRDPAAPDRPR